MTTVINDWRNRKEEFANWLLKDFPQERGANNAEELWIAYLVLHDLDEDDDSLWAWAQHYGKWREHHGQEQD